MPLATYTQCYTRAALNNSCDTVNPEHWKENQWFRWGISFYFMFYFFSVQG